MTGYGLLGHLSEMLSFGVGATIDLDRVPLLDGVRRLPPELRTTSAIGANTAYVRESTAVRSRRPDGDLAPLFDAQTNGGLLVAAPPESRAKLEHDGFTRIGAVTGQGFILVD